MTLSIVILDASTLTTNEGAASGTARTLASFTSHTSAALLTTYRAAEAEGDHCDEEAGESSPCEAVCFDAEVRILTIASESVATFDSPGAECVSLM